MENKLDTVGAIVLDSKGNFASAVSSGGILLKHPGRVGHASMFGCGCWVQNEQDEEEETTTEANDYAEFNGLNCKKETSNKKQRHSVAICTTGCGKLV